MITRSSIDQVFEKLQEDPENCKCADCSCPSPVFSSISHGSFICSLCAGVHTSALSDCSETKSLLNNDWSVTELKKIISGGNSALKEFTDYYGITQFPIEIKYNTKAMHLYRRMLGEITLGHTFEEDLPTVEIGRSLNEIVEDNRWFQGLFNKTKDIGSQALQQLNEITRKTRIGDTAGMIIKEMHVDSIKSRTSEAFGVISNKIRRNYDISRETVHKITHETLTLLQNIEESIETGLTRAKNIVTN